MKNLLKKKVFIIPVAIILYLIVFTIAPKLIGAVTLIAGIGGSIYLYTKNEKFKLRSKGIKILTGIAIFFGVFIFGIGGLAYDSKGAEQKKLATEQVKVEQQAKEEQTKKATEEETNQDNKVTSVETNTKSDIKKDFSEDVKTHLDGTKYLKSSSINGNSVKIEYAYNNLDSAAKEYFETGDKINKILMEAPIRIVRHYPDIKNVSIIIQSSNKKYSIDITREQIESFTGVKMDTIKTDDDWREKISNKFFVKNIRSEFIKKYVKIE